jgi:hypothetical protein
MAHAIETVSGCGCWFELAGAESMTEGCKMNVSRGAIGVILALAAVSCGSRVSIENAESVGAGAGGSPTGESGTPADGGSPAGASGTPADGGTADDPLAVSWTDPTTADDCKASPLSYQTYSNEAELDTLLVGRWRRCKAPQIAGEDVGVEFTADGNFYALTFNAAHEVVRQVGIDYGGQWTYLPVGTVTPISPKPITRAEFLLQGGYTDAPQFTNGPRQMRILFSPVLGIYVPLTP